MPAGINRAGSRGGNASVMVATESFERVSALAAPGGMPGLCPSYRPAFPARRESPPGGIFRNNRSPLDSGAGSPFFR